MTNSEGEIAEKDNCYPVRSPTISPMMPVMTDAYAMRKVQPGNIIEWRGHSVPLWPLVCTLIAVAVLRLFETAPRFASATAITGLTLGSVE